MPTTRTTLAQHFVRSAICFVLGSSLLLICGASLSRDASASPTDKSSRDLQPLDEVTVSARKDIDRRTLEHVVVPRFVESHGGASERSGQIGRWHESVCPETFGLQPLSNEFVSRRVVDVARRVGVPTKNAGKCTPNVEIIFSPQPQKQLDYIASKNKAYLGYSEHPRHLGEFTHVIQAWYVTGTRTFVTIEDWCTGSRYYCPPPPPSAGGLGIDSANSGTIGRAGSLLGSDSRSEFVHVTVIADANALVRYPLHAVADYVAMVALTRTALDGCNALPSIIDILSADCGARARPESITEADIAYLRALYSSDLEFKLNFERGELKDKMLKALDER
jgi:hypothetical protein